VKPQDDRADLRIAVRLSFILAGVLLIELAVSLDGTRGALALFTTGVGCIFTAFLDWVVSW